MIIRLPFPDRALSPNRKAGRSWRTTAEAKAQARDAGFVAAKQALSQGPLQSSADGWIPLSLVFVTPTKHRRDLDNMLGSAKHVLDGMAAGLGIDDSMFKPVLVDWVAGDKPGAIIAAVGVTIVSSVVVA